MIKESFNLSGAHVILGDCLTALSELAAESVDSVVTDPPYALDARGLGSVREAGCVCAEEHAGLSATSGCVGETSEARGEGSDWAVAPMLGMRSQNWSESATHSRGFVDNDAGMFEDWCRAWASECLRVLKPGGHVIAFGGTPTWHRMASGIEDAGFVIRGSMAWLYATGFAKGLNVGASLAGSKSIGGASAQQRSGGGVGEWDGWATALKPGHEPMVLARKPLIGTVAQNVRAYGTGGLNVDGCRVGGGVGGGSEPGDASVGRWPSDVFLDGAAAALLDEKAGGRPVAEFFWHAKPGSSERVTVDGVSHPTVKPLSLMRELVRLVTPPMGTVLDPFAGSGATVEACILEGMRCVAIEREAAYVALIRQRVQRQSDPVAAVLASGEEPGLFGLFS